MRQARYAVLAMVALGACATPKKVAADEAFGKPTAVDQGPAKAQQRTDGSFDPTGPIDDTVSPEKFVKMFRRGNDCELAARGLQRTNPDRAWSYLKACATKTGFSALDVLFESWSKDLRARGDANLVVAAVLTSRGGHLLRDLDTLAQKRFPLFDLGTAAGQPGLYKGKAVVFLGQVKKVKAAKGRVEITVAELSAQGDAAPTASSLTYRADEGESGGSLDETGREVQVRTPNPDPFLTPGRKLLFLGKFESAKETEEEDSEEGPKTTAHVGLTTYYDLGVRDR